jgi:hypothetical protein
MTTETPHPPLTFEQAAEMVGGNWNIDGTLCKIIGVDPQPPKCVAGVYLVIYDGTNTKRYVKVG